jgi:hypothetical protein
LFVSGSLGIGVRYHLQQSWKPFFVCGKGRFETIGGKGEVRRGRATETEIETKRLVAEFTGELTREKEEKQIETRRERFCFNE